MKKYKVTVYLDWGEPWVFMVHTPYGMKTAVEDVLLNHFPSEEEVEKVLCEKVEE